MSKGKAMSDRGGMRYREAGVERGARARRTIVTKGRVAAASACLVGGFIVLNAVAFQTEKHPMPLFHPVAKAPETFPVPPMRPEQAVKAAAFDPKPAAGVKPMAAQAMKAAAPVASSLQTAQPPAEATEALLSELQRELSKRGFYKGEPDGKPGKATTQAIRDFQFAQRVPVDGKPSEALLKDVIATKSTMKDELLDLVKRSAQDDKASKTVMDVQRALNKAGYGPLSEDGQMGPSTKTALAKFEQDKKLPQTGEPKGPVLRVLASASGVQITR